MLTTLHPLLVALSVYVAFHAAVTDLRTGRIPNGLTLSFLAAAPLVHGFLSGPGALGAALLGAVLCAAIPVISFFQGGIGGGDVKLFAALGALVGAELGLQIQFLSLVFTLLYALGKLSWQGELLATAGRSLVLFVRPFRSTAGRARSRDARAAGITIRIGGAIALATFAVLAPEMLAWMVA